MWLLKYYEGPLNPNFDNAKVIDDVIAIAMSDEFKARWQACDPPPSEDKHWISLKWLME